ncbi:putative BBS2 protein [Blattamonas nauphoetae]|uniref:BBS2 protein n=1 Tax=Blattamonas nauphoetae TaxID=2049346 RepID=A0ABQ9Y9L7_9EUKA|nr:putative BBS2 protein [Blattamonas nauphoetae]
MDAFKIAAFDFTLKTKIGDITSGTFEPNTPSIVCSTERGKILLFTPNFGAGNTQTVYEEDSSAIRTLSINGKVVGLATGVLDHEWNRDSLIIGMETTVRAYDVFINSDHFFSTVNDGVNGVCILANSPKEDPLVYAAGNGSVRGLNKRGEEESWILTGEEVKAMTPFTTEGGDVGLLLSTANSRIQFFKRGELAFSISESDDATHLEMLSPGNFAYSLESGTVGVYSNSLPLWKHTYASEVTAIAGFDCDSDGEAELIIALSDGTIEGRRQLSGEVVFTNSIHEHICKLFKWKNILSEPEKLCVATTDGHILGYAPSVIDYPDLPPTVRQAIKPVKLENAPQSLTATIPLSATPEELLEFLTEKKNSLLRKVEELEGLVKTKKTTLAVENAIPPTTKVKVYPKTNESKKRLELVLSFVSSSSLQHCNTNNDTVIKAVVLFSDIMFPQGSFIHVAQPPSSLISFPINPPKHKPLTIVAAVLVGNRGQDTYHVFKQQVPLKRFPLHVCVQTPIQFDSHVTFTLSDRIERIAIWLSTAFPLVVKETVISELNVTFRCFGDDNDPLQIVAVPSTNGGVRVTILGKLMATVTEVVSDIYDFFNVHECTSVACFPTEISNFRTTLKRIIDLNLLRVQLTADIAERTGNAKVALVKAEDARLMGDMVELNEWLQTLDSENKELLKGYRVRQKNHEDLMSGLKEVNKVIQYASRMRRGTAALKIINESRSAIRQNKIDAIVKIVETGGTYFAIDHSINPGSSSSVNMACCDVEHCASCINEHFKLYKFCPFCQRQYNEDNIRALSLQERLSLFGKLSPAAQNQQLPEVESQSKTMWDQGLKVLEGFYNIVDLRKQKISTHFEELRNSLQEMLFSAHEELQLGYMMYLHDLDQKKSMAQTALNNILLMYNMVLLLVQTGKSADPSVELLRSFSDQCDQLTTKIDFLAKDCSLRGLRPEDYDDIGGWKTYFASMTESAALQQPTLSENPETEDKETRLSLSLPLETRVVSNPGRIWNDIVSPRVECWFVIDDIWTDVIKNEDKLVVSPLFTHHSIHFPFDVSVFAQDYPTTDIEEEEQQAQLIDITYGVAVTFESLDAGLRSLRTELSRPISSPLSCKLPRLIVSLVGKSKEKSKIIQLKQEDLNGDSSIVIPSFFKHPEVTSYRLENDKRTRIRVVVEFDSWVDIAFSLQNKIYGKDCTVDTLVQPAPT